MNGKYIRLIFIMILASSCARRPAPVTDQQQLPAAPLNIILIVGSGMGMEHIAAAAYKSGGSLNLANFPVSGMAVPGSADALNTKPGSGNYAISTGNAPGIEGNPHHLLQLAREMNKATGIITSGILTMPSTAAFISHHYSVATPEALALEYFNFMPGVMIGGGKNQFMQRTDGKNFTPELTRAGYKVSDKIENIDRTGRRRVAAFLVDGNMSGFDMGGAEMLQQSWRAARGYLDRQQQGFFLVIESSHIEWASNINSFDKAVAEVKELDKLAFELMGYAFANGRTLVIVTSGNECGGLSITGGKGENITASWASRRNTGNMVPVFAFGPGAENFRGVYPVNQLYYKINELMRRP